MNNLFSYCGLTDARMRDSEKDLPVRHHNFKIIDLLAHWTKYSIVL